MAAGLPSTARCFVLRGLRHAGRIPAHAQPFGIVGEHDGGRARFEECAMMARAMLLLAIGQSERAVEGVRMRARQDGERGEPLRIPVGDAPRDAAAPVVADEMEALSGQSRCCDLHRVIDQPVEDIVVGVRRIGPRARRIAALARRNRAIAGTRQRRDLRIPVMEATRQSRAAAARARPAPARRSAHRR